MREQLSNSRDRMGRRRDIFGERDRERIMAAPFGKPFPPHIDNRLRFQEEEGPRIKGRGKRGRLTSTSQSVSSKGNAERNSCREGERERGRPPKRRSTWGQRDRQIHTRRRPP